LQNWYAETTLLAALITDVKQISADKVKTVHALHKRLQQITAYQSIPKSNLYRWFTLQNNRWKPTAEFKANVRAGKSCITCDCPCIGSTAQEMNRDSCSRHTGANLQLKLSTGRPPLLKGAEATLDAFEEQIRSLRAAGFSLSLATLRSLLISLLLRDEQQDLISDHIHKAVPADFVPDKSKFWASDYWLL
jgi:hypothetical protein